MDFKIVTERNCSLLTLHSLSSQAEVDPVLQAVEAELEKGSRNFVVDLSHMQYINSVGINFLIQLKRSCAEAKGKMAICHASDKVKELLQILRLGSMFFLTDSKEEALLFLRA